MNKTNDKNTQRRTNLRQERLTIRSANLLFLISMIVMMATLGIPTPGWSPHWVSIITTALFLLLALLFLRYHKLPPRVTLRLRWPGRRNYRRPDSECPGHPPLLWGTLRALARKSRSAISSSGGGS